MGRLRSFAVVTALSLVVLLAAVAASAGTEAVRRLALRGSILDIPNDRSSHVTPTPRGGGLAIAVVVVTGWTVFGVGAETTAVLGLALPAIGIAAVSAVDDVRSLPARVRFGVHLGAAFALLVAFGGWGTVAVPLLGTVNLGVTGFLLSVLWLVGLTNAYNFMDGIDGIAGLQAVVAGAAWVGMGVILESPVVAWTGGLAAGGSLGFLVLNWAPARIFMGDIGSAFLGFLFAALALVAEGGRVPLAALLFVWPFVFDTMFTFVRRLSMKENVLEAHRSHLYQRLVIARNSHAAVSSLYGALAILSAGSGLVWASTGLAAAAGVGLAIPPVTISAWVWQAELRAGSAEKTDEGRVEGIRGGTP